MTLTGLNVIYIATMTLLFFMCLYLGKNTSSKEQFVFIMVMLFAGFIVMGNMFEINSVNIQEAIVGRKISFIGNCFTEWFLLIFVLLFFRKRAEGIITYSLLGLNFVVLIIEMSCDKNNLIYTSLEYVRTNGIGRIISTPGPVNYVNRALSAIYVIAIVVICIKHFVENKKSKERWGAIHIIICAMLPALGYFFMATGISGIYDWTPLFIAGSTLVAYFLVVRVHLFDTLEVAQDKLLSDLTDAVVILDKDMQLLYMNKKAEALFGDISFDGDYGFLMDMCRFTVEQYERNGRTYKLQTNKVYNRRKFYGFTMVFSDVTELVHYAGELKDEVALKANEIERIQHQVLYSFANMIEMRDDMTGQHVKRTTEYVRVLVDELLARGMYADELNEENAARMVSAAALHDIGKIAISDIILQKPARLTDDEFEIIKTHSEIGSKMIDEILMEVGNNDYLSEAKRMAMFHHEKWDGNGYPSGLKGEEIPISARIMAVADVFDALISKRQYKDAFSLDEAYEIIEDSKGSHFDPDIAQVFIELRPQVEKIIIEFEE